MLKPRHIPLALYFQAQLKWWILWIRFCKYSMMRMLLGCCGIVWMGCGSTKGSQIPVEPTWQRFSDQEKLELLKLQEGALWGIAQGQLLVWNTKSERLHRASTPLPTAIHVHDLWVETVDATRLNQAREAYYQKYIKKLKEQTSTSSKLSQSKEQAIVDESGIEIEGIEIEGIEIEEDQKKKTQTSSTKSEDVDLDLSDIVIDTTASESTTRPQLNAKKEVKIPPPPLKVRWRFRVYVASSKGIFTREVWLDQQWRDLLGDQAWRSLYQNEVTQLVPRKTGGAWWAGSRGFGWLQRGKVATKVERFHTSHIAIHADGGAWIALTHPSTKKVQILKIDEQIWHDGGEPLGIEELSLEALFSQLDSTWAERFLPCEGELKYLLGTDNASQPSSQVNFAQNFALCLREDKENMIISLFREGRWWPMSTSFLIDQSSVVASTWGVGLILRVKDEWWVLRQGMATLALSADGARSQNQRILALTEKDQKESNAPQFYLEKLKVEDLLPYQQGAWTAGYGSDGDPWLSWMRAYQGVVSRMGDQATLRKRFETESFAAYNETRPYSLDAQGTLWVPQLQGASTYALADQNWGFVQGPPGRTLGVAHCQNETIFIVSSRIKKPKKSLSLELWRPGEQKPLVQIDWSEGNFRVGEPKLGDVACDAKGAIYGALFWGQGWSGNGVGVLYLPADRSKIEIWGARQGYDGEDEVTQTPLLPDFTVNAIATAPNRSVFLATNSGLAIVSSPESLTNGRRTLTLLSESTGWVTDFINDVSVAADGRAWVATDQGLYELDSQLKSRLATLKLRVSAVGVDPNRALIWIAFQDKLYRGNGQMKTWQRVQVSGNFPVGTIKRILPFEQSDQNVSKTATTTGSAQVWLATTRGLLQARP